MPAIEGILRSELNDRQFAAATDPSREVLCLACAGSGKSRTLAYRIARLVAEGANPSGIVAFTFTEKAADAIGLQVARALASVGVPETTIGALFIGTIHSYCQYVLGQIDARYRQFDVLDANRLKLYLMSRYHKLGIKRLRDQRGARYFEAITKVADSWSILNDEMLDIDSIEEHDEPLYSVLQALDAGLDEDEFIDFSLMIRLVTDALERGDPGAGRAISGLEHLMVDEYQDVNPAQERLISELHRRSGTLFSVGDDDQTLYAWRGADISNILEFEDRYPECSTHTLSTNYRSTPAIVATADDFIAQELGARRMAKDPEAIERNVPRDLRVLWFDARGDEANWVADRISSLLHTAYLEDDGQVRGLTPGDFAILMRSTRSPEGPAGAKSPRHAPFTRALEQRGINYSLEAAGGVFDRPHAAALRSALGLLRASSPTRQTAREFFDAEIAPVYPTASFDEFTQVLSRWGREVHAPSGGGGARRRVYPQQLVHDLLAAFGVATAGFDESVMRDLGVVSRVLQDVEAVFVSVDSAERFAGILNFLDNVAAQGYEATPGDAQRRPDAVTVSTVHQVKGLEFPAVFIVDVENARFPGSIRAYSHWLPREVLDSALRRGAYQGSRDEEARLFYTALTRAERYLHVSGSRSLPGGRKRWPQSQFVGRMQHDELATDPSGGPRGLRPHRPVPRVDENIVPTTYSDIRYYLRCPKDFQFRKAFGFSPPVPDLFGFGMTVHASIGKLHELYTERAPSADEAQQVAEDLFHLKHVPPSSDPEERPGAYENAKASAGKIARSYADGYATDFARCRQVEVRFEVPVESAVISGSIDLLLNEDENGRILEAEVVDFKAMEGGPDPVESRDLEWTELALQVQLYAKAAREVLGEDARTGAVHMLKDGQRIQVPVDEGAVKAAVENVEWAVERVLAGDFPMRPDTNKCASCDFRLLCPKTNQPFRSDHQPPPLHMPDDQLRMVPAFSKAGDSDRDT